MNDPTAEALLIDRAGAARRLEEAEISEWAEDQRVFVSSVMDGYSEPRQAAAAAIEAMGAQPVLFERFGGRDADPNAAYLAEVESSSIYVGLLGERYGHLLPDRFSASHAEYLHAEKHGLRLSVWAQEGVEREGRQQSFLDEVRTFNVTGSFAGPAQLQAGLEARLRAIAAEDLSPWCKLGRCLFRARQISVGGGTATIEAVIRSDAVADAINSLDTEFGRSRTTFVYWDSVHDAEVQSVASVSRTGGSRQLTIELAVAKPQTPTRYGLNGMEWDEITELAIRVSWLGEANPLGLMQSEAEIADPFSTLAELDVPEESLRPIAFILAYEILVRSRGIGRLTRLRLGPSVAGRRRVAITWVPERAYSNQPDPTPRTLEGAVDLA
jgi:hypothetical protein